MCNIPSEAAILEVGSGYCQKTRFLKSIGYNNILSVEINEQLVENAKNKGFNAVTIKEFEQKYKDVKFDVLFLSHILEHFQYHDLKHFLEHYFVFLKDYGHIIIATPIYQNAFYDDFDHVKPYSHLGLLSVFGNDVFQVQYYSKFKLEILLI